jgi:hypothetical protein
VKGKELCGECKHPNAQHSWWQGSTCDALVCSPNGLDYSCDCGERVGR